MTVVARQVTEAAVDALRRSAPPRRWPRAREGSHPAASSQNALGDLGLQVGYSGDIEVPDLNVSPSSCGGALSVVRRMGCRPAKVRSLAAGRLRPGSCRSACPRWTLDVRPPGSARRRPHPNGHSLCWGALQAATAPDGRQQQCTAAAATLRGRGSAPRCRPST